MKIQAMTNENELNIISMIGIIKMKKENFIIKIIIHIVKWVNG